MFVFNDVWKDLYYSSFLIITRQIVYETDKKFHAYVKQINGCEDSSNTDMRSTVT